MVSKLTPKTIIIIFLIFLILGFINEYYYKNKYKKTENIDITTSLINKKDEK